MDVSTLVALGGAIAFVAVFLYYQNQAKPIAKAIVGFTESELAALSSGSKKLKKKIAPKEKKVASPKNEKKSEAKPAAPVASRRLKNVDGAADQDTDEAMLSFLSNKITLETKRKNAEAEAEEEKPKVKKGPKEPVVAEKPAAGFTAVVEKKKPAKKEADETIPEEKKEEPEKKRVKSFFKADAEDEKKAFEARKAEREQREKDKAAGIRRPRDPNAPPRPPRQQRPEDEQNDETGADGERRSSRPPKSYPPPVAATTTDMFEEWSIDSMLDSITASPAEKTVKRTYQPRTAPAAASAKADDDDSVAEPATDAAAE